jgi:TANFOR domain-containing protein
MKKLFRIWNVLSILGFHVAFGQLHPVQVTTQLVPPYSVYLSDYATPGNDKLRLVIIQRDITKPSYQIRLQVSVELNGKTIFQTSPLFSPAPITLDAGIPTIISGNDLQPYIDSRNLDFIGINRDDYERTKALPEGNYQICVTAYDYHRQDVAVSLPGCSFFFLAKDEPPIVNFPPCGTAIPFQNPQQIIFQWLPRNTSSANSANNTEYEFSLYESRPAGRNPNDVVLSSPVVYQTTTENTQVIYSISEPILLENMNYVWRVRAIDKGGKDSFRNNGYSEVCTFSYGGNATTVQLDAIKDLVAQGVAERKGTASWTATQQEIDGYITNYRKTGAANWFNQQTKEANSSLVDLEPNTEYEVRVQAYAGPTYGPYSDVRKFKTPKAKVYVCGDPLPQVNDTLKAINAVTENMIVSVQGIELTLKETQGPASDGTYSGKGEVSIPYFGGAVFHVTFKNLFITTDRTANKGRIDFNTQKVDDWIKDEVAQQKKDKLAEQQQDNKDHWKGTDFYDKVIYYNDSTISDIETNSGGDVVITGDDGEQYVNPEIKAILKDAPEKGIIVEDKTGNQWVVQKDKDTGEIKATKVPGGGLSPNMDVVVTDAALEYINKALLELLSKYPKEKLDGLADELKIKESLLEDLIEEYAYENDLDEIQLENDNDPEMLNRELDFIGLSSSGTTDDTEFGDAKHKDLSSLFYTTETEYKVGNIVTIFAAPGNIKAASTMIAPELKMGDVPVSQFIDQQKQQSSSEENIIHQVALGIKSLLGQLANDAGMEDIKFQLNEN